MFDIEIIRIPILPFGIVNAHLIRSEAGCILVDTGFPGSERKIGRLLARHGLSFRDVKLIIVTHAHTDHAGSAARVSELSGAPILAREADVACHNRNEPTALRQTNMVRRLLSKTPTPHEPYEGFEPDILMKSGETLNLLNFGVDGLVRHTAGHTSGSIAVELISQDALVGGLIASGILIGSITFGGRAIRPRLREDRWIVAAELERLVRRGTKRFHLGHGGRLEAAEVMRYVRSLTKIATDLCSAVHCNHQSR